jgi:hypothetical protein
MLLKVLLQGHNTLEVNINPQFPRLNNALATWPSTKPIIFFYLDLSCSFLPLDEKSFLKSRASQFEFPSSCDFDS